MSDHHRLTTVLSACNLNLEYTCFIPYFIRAWKKIFPEIEVVVVLIADTIPSELEEYKEHLRLFPPLEGISTAFTAQFIRILYPALLKTNGSVLISDIDMIPMNTTYYTKNFEKYSSDKFIVYRDVCGPTQYAICYNLATPKVWGETFNITTEEEVKERLLFYNKGYDDIKGSASWYKDQEILKEQVVKVNPVILSDHEQGYNRLDRIHMDYILLNKGNYIAAVSNHHFSDFHLPNYKTYKEFIELVISNL